MSVHSQVLVAMSKNSQNESSINKTDQTNDTKQSKNVEQMNQNESIKRQSNGLINETNLQNHSSSIKELNSSNHLNSSNNSSLTSDHNLNESKNDSKNDSNISSNVSSKLNLSTISSNKNPQESNLENGHITDDSSNKFDLFPNTIFNLKELFRLSVKFTKENENKAFHPTYDDRNYLYALNYQIKLGIFDENKAPQPGALDFVGKDRRLAWKSLGNLSKEDAMKQFITKLNEICSSFKPFIEAHNQEKVERERLLREEEERRRIEEEKRFKEEEEERLKNEEAKKKEKQRQEVREALKKQTFYQFQSYAQEQYPNDPAAQEQLIKSLEELHYQQFVQQIMQFQEQNPLGSIANQQMNSEHDTNELIDNMQQFNLNGNKLERVATNSSTTLPNSSSKNLTSNLDNQFNKMNQQDFVNNQRYLVDHEESNNEETSEEDEEDEENSQEEEQETDNESTSIEYDNYEGKSVQVAVPQMWTKKIIKQFKESISIDSGDGIIKVGYGETLTIRVPTHPDGNCIVWEFATDNYDIGFGLFFNPNENPGDQVIIQTESEDDEEDDDEENESSDLEKAAGRKVNKKSNKTQYVLPIIPVYRRDCFEEVYCGSHVYPGKGTYLLKFDNTYSLWRAKTLYYRVFFSS